MNQTVFDERRARLCARMNALGGGVAILPAGREQTRNADTLYPFRQDSSFYYLTGFPEPDAIALFIAGARLTSILFCRSKHPERETWDGFRYGPQAAGAQFNFDAAFSLEEVDVELPRLLENQPALFVAMGVHAAFDASVQKWLECVRTQSRRGVFAPNAIYDIRRDLAQMRQVKDAFEIETMRRAASISAAAHLRAMHTARPGLYEYEVEAEILAEFRRRGSQAPAYNSIVAAGANACVLHYTANNRQMKDGELLLIDAGCELDCYASDVTRTFPVNGRFDGPQRDLYQLVLLAQQEALAATAPGVTWDIPHDRATRTLAQGMLDLGLIEGSLDAVLESGSYRQFYMHRTGHWLGMDVHDVGDYHAAPSPAGANAERTWCALVEGMVLTVEPGIYVRSGPGVPEAFWNIGIRIEDDVLVTRNGCEVLSDDAPKSISEIETAMRT